MTHDILQSDIDLARRYLEIHRPEDEIVEALRFRGVDSNRARQLIADIQAGKNVQPDKPITIKLSPKPVHEKVTSAEPENQGSTRRPRSPRVGSKPRKQDGFPWFTIIAVTSAAVCVVAFVFLSRKSHEADSKERTSRTGENPIADGRAGRRSDSDRMVNSKSISLEVESEGLRLCGVPVMCEDFVGSVFKTLGAPTRTNQVEKADQIVYAYDDYGLLMYSPKVSAHCSLVLDFDGSDGAAGTKKAFVGTFKIKNQIVQAGTDAASLGLIKELALDAPKSASGIIHAQCGTFQLVFGYLKGPERLSFIEIDFK